MDLSQSAFLPNLLYLLLVAGIWAAALGVVTPGTGILEGLALLCFGAVGLGTLLIPLNPWGLALMLLGLLVFGGAVWRRQMLWLGLAALIFSLASIFLFRHQQAAAGVNPWLAVLVSASTLGFFWITIRQGLLAMGDRPAHDLSMLIGQRGEVRTELNLEGSVYAGGELWSARAEQPIAPGARVVITGRRGLVLEVEEDRGISTPQT